MKEIFDTFHFYVVKIFLLKNSKLFTFISEKNKNNF